MQNAPHDLMRHLAERQGVLVAVKPDPEIHLRERVEAVALDEVDQQARSTA